MDPSALERLGLRPGARPQGRDRAERAIAARSLMYLFAVGAIIAGAALAASLSPTVDHARIAVTAGGAAGIAVALFFAYEATPRWALGVFLLVGSMLIEWAVYASRDPQSPFLVFYLWIAFYAFYFLTRTQAILQMAFVGFAYAAVLERSTEPFRTSLLRWVVFTIAMMVAGLLVRMLRERIDSLLRELGTASKRDMLTGLLDEHGWDELLQKELERARRSGNRVGIVVGQIDGDAPLGAALGARRADELLAEVGGLLGSTIRLNDEAARVDGEQFAVVCPYTDERGATIMAERAGSIVRDRESEERHTISFGVASYPKHGTSPEALMHAARYALDEARGLGGDRAVPFFATDDAIQERLRTDADIEIEVVAAEYG